VTYVEAWSIRAKKSGEPSATDTGMIATAKPGQKPAGVIVDERTVTPPWSPSIGRSTRSPSRARGQDLHGAGSPRQNRQVKAGDAVEFKLVEGLAVAVEKPQR
jgi:hypothetical protein